MFSKISLRNIPIQIFQALEGMAERHDRSTEAEARQAIQSWVQPVLIQEERSTRLKDVSQRLTRLLEQVNAGLQGRVLRPSQVAQMINQERAAEVEDWFLGNIEPTFSQLEAIANCFGINVNWLQHGQDHIYPVDYVRLSESPDRATEWLLAWEGAEGDTLKNLHLIRSKKDEGSLYIVKESTRGHFRIYTTPTHVSDSIGAGGEAMLKSLFVTLELLYRRWTKNSGEYRVTSYLLDPAEITQLINGSTNPAALLRESNESMWWEDIWDRSMVMKHEYWPGWRSLCDRIESAIQGSDHLVQMRQNIRKGELADNEMA